MTMFLALPRDLAVPFANYKLASSSHDLGTQLGLLARSQVITPS